MTGAAAAETREQASVCDNDQLDAAAAAAAGAAADDAAGDNDAMRWRHLMQKPGQVDHVAAHHCLLQLLPPVEQVAQRHTPAPVVERMRRKVC